MKSPLALGHHQKQKGCKSAAPTIETERQPFSRVLSTVLSCNTQHKQRQEISTVCSRLHPRAERGRRPGNDEWRLED